MCDDDAMSREPGAARQNNEAGRRSKEKKRFGGQSVRSEGPSYEFSGEDWLKGEVDACEPNRITIRTKWLNDSTASNLLYYNIYMLST